MTRLVFACDCTIHAGSALDIATPYSTLPVWRVIDRTTRHTRNITMVRHRRRIARATAVSLWHRCVTRPRFLVPVCFFAQTTAKKASLTLGKEFPNFHADSSHGPIDFHEWLGG